MTTNKIGGITGAAVVHYDKIRTTILSRGGFLEQRGINTDNVAAEIMVQTITDLSLKTPKQVRDYMDKRAIEFVNNEVEIYEKFGEDVKKKGYKRMDKNEAVRVAKLFNDARIGILKRPNCPFCGTTDPYVLDGKRKELKCRNSECRKKFSNTTGTYLDNCKLPPIVIYKAVVRYKNDPSVSSRKLSSFLGVTQKTSWRLKYKIESCVNAIRTRNVEKVIEKLLTPSRLDTNPPIKRQVNHFGRKFDVDQLPELHTLYKGGAFTIPELAEKYDMSPRAIRHWLFYRDGKKTPKKQERLKTVMKVLHGEVAS